MTHKAEVSDNQDANHVKRVFPRGVWPYLLLALGISWGAYFLRGIDAWTAGVDEALRLVVKFGPSLAGLLAAAWLYRAQGVADILKRLVPSLRHLRWTIFALAMPLMVLAVAAGLRGFSDPNVLAGGTLSVTAGLSVYLSLLATHFFAGGGLGEELGWRGFMLARLLTVMPPLKASLIIGSFHALWHLPAYGAGTLLLLGFTLAMAVTATWIYQRTQGNLFAIVLLHANGNAGLRLLEALYPRLDNDLPVVLATFLLWIAFAALLGWRMRG